MTLPHETTAILMYQNSPVGVELFSLTLSFVSIFSSIPEWLPQTHSFLKHNFVGFHLSFLLKRYRYHKIFFIQGRKRYKWGYKESTELKKTQNMSLKVSFRKSCQCGSILAESICVLLTKKEFFCSGTSERIKILVFQWCKATIFEVSRVTDDKPPLLILPGASRPGNWTPFHSSDQRGSVINDYL